MSRQTIDETERVRRLWDRAAPRFDKSMCFFERVLFQGDREWVCSQAEGEVLELAVGTGRNFPYYPAGIRLTGIELSEEMLDLARAQATELGREFDLRLGDAGILRQRPQHGLRRGSDPRSARRAGARGNGVVMATGR
jgi:SAM-dependent methyltransferase